MAGWWYVRTTEEPFPRLAQPPSMNTPRSSIVLSFLSALRGKGEILRPMRVSVRVDASR